MSIRSPRSSWTTDCTRLPFIPTQAPTGSTSLSPGHNGDLRATAGLSGGGLDPNDAFVHLGNFLLEELRQHLDAGSRKNDL